MRTTFCTIITADFINYALALYDSLSRFKTDIDFKILIADERTEFKAVEKEFPTIEIIQIQDICQSGLAKKVYDQYYEANRDCFRWSMKSVLLKHLLELGYEQAFFLDPDLYFFNSFDFLVEELNNHSVLLTPHWRASNPYQDPNNFAILQTSGLFNAGFVGVSQTGIPTMEWWSKVCVYECVKAPERGLFDDQAYLDLIPIYFDNVKILKHRGCNIANWNQIECKRTNNQQGKILINNYWDIIFIHFTRSTIKGIQSGNDKLLTKYLEQYQTSLEEFSKFIPEESKRQIKMTTNKVKENEIKKYFNKFGVNYLNKLTQRNKQ